MSKPAALFLILFSVSIIAFGTWQLFRGDLTAAFSTLPFLFITYLFVKSQSK